ncbi:DMT family transporter [Fusobacterium sp. PH5-44]|uniref:DMT family transporter n=1 Tax=unclassified Fusobacterium TaxID=2648384 RepID=UPI003D1C379B
MKERKKGIILVVMASVFWSMGGLLMKMVTWNGFAISGIRAIIAAMVIFPFIKKLNFKFTRGRILSIIAYTGATTVYAVANKYTTAANAILLQYTAPIYAAIMGYFFLKEKIHKRDIFAIGIILFGMILFVKDGLASGNLLGDGLALLSGVAFAGVSVTLRLEKDNDPMQNVFWGNIVGFLVSIPFIGNLEISSMNIIGILALGIFQLGTAYVFFVKGIKYVTALEGVLIPMLEPILNPIWVMFFIGEIPSKMAVCGGAIIIFGVLIREILRIYTEKKEILIN